MFIDEALITVAGGKGGNGCVSFRREKYVPRGGPDGGDGGDGGSVILTVNPSMSTLLEFRYRRQFKAERGRHGAGANKTGRSGTDLLVAVPVGTAVLDHEAVQLLADLTRPGQRFIAARGGHGGRGNARFTSSTNRAPTRHEPGTEGEHRELRLELKLLADVGLLGFPNAGKSTLISRISAARPKIADYPFTTLEPHLGVVAAPGFHAFVVADIPGLIEGAHAGAGLGLRFLRHVERCRLLLHLVDPTDAARDPVQGIQALERELRCYGGGLESKPRMLVMTKADAVQDEAPVRQVQNYALQHGRSCHQISAVTGQGLASLVREVAARLSSLRSAAPAEGLEA